MRQRAVVVFLGKELVEGYGLHANLLKPGFVHCFVLVESRGWVKIEGRYGSLRITQLGEFEDIVAHYENQGATVIDTFVENDSSIYPLVSRTCVGLVKVVLNIRSWSQTPWQLYKHLRDKK